VCHHPHATCLALLPLSETSTGLLLSKVSPKPSCRETKPCFSHHDLPQHSWQNLPMEIISPVWGLGFRVYLHIFLDYSTSILKNKVLSTDYSPCHDKSYLAVLVPTPTEYSPFIYKINHKTCLRRQCGETRFTTMIYNAMLMATDFSDSTYPCKWQYDEHHKTQILHVHCQKWEHPKVLAMSGQKSLK
jgi:hypothetical protein